MDRNFWDEATPPGFTDQREEGRVVELCVYSFEGSAKDLDQVRADVEEADRIWCQSRINVQAIHWDRLGPLPVREPVNLNSPTLAETVVCRGDQFPQQFFEIGLPACPAADLTRVIPVFYIPPRAFSNGSLGCHQFRFNDADEVKNVILLTDDANGRVLAHELGHALLTRKVGPNNWINDDPGPGMNAADRKHDTDPQNVMFPHVSMNPQISPDQAWQADQSHLVTSQALTYGFRENKPFKLGVKMKTLHVKDTSDEGTDDDLESTWEFRVKTPLTNVHKGYSNDSLGAGDHSLDLDFPLLELASDGDELTLEVTGEDWDFWSPNDSMPTATKTWKKGTDLWGSASADPGAPPGDHKDGPYTNDEIEYSFTYNIRVDDRPNETTFRNVC